MSLGPSDAELLAAWERLKADPDEGGAFALLVHAPLVTTLSARNSRADAAAVLTAVGDTILYVLRDPAKYDRDQSSPFHYLLMIAGRKLKSWYTGETRHHRQRIPWESVELDATERNEEEEDVSFSFDVPELQAVIAAFTEPERRVFELMRDGERSTAVFAAALGISDRPLAEQEAEVKRAKDRLKARLKRAVGGGG